MPHADRRGQPPVFPQITMLLIWEKARPSGAHHNGIRPGRAVARRVHSRRRATEGSAMNTYHPDIRRRLRDRLYALTPRAFEVFSGDLLREIGLQNVQVTQYIGDGGVDATAELVSPDGLLGVPTGVQVKRFRGNIGRPEIDRFVGALFGKFQYGIFITTADFADAARAKAVDTALRINLLNGNDVATVLLRQGLGMVAGEDQLDEGYFSKYEHVLEQPTAPSGPAITPGELLSLRAFSYELRVDQNTLRHWVERARVQPDRTVDDGGRVSHFFFSTRAASLREHLGLSAMPIDGVQWRQQFLDYVRRGNLTKSYKPVLLLALLDLADRNGEVPLDDLSRAFLDFYQQRQRDGLPIEFGVPLLADPVRTPLNEIRRLIVRYPLDRFMIQRFVELDADLARITPQLWRELRISDLIELRAAANEQLRAYYARQQMQRTNSEIDA
jgi:hypothetical protein